MRLLRLEEVGGFSLVDFSGGYIPQYAILSHTWGEDHEEVTFRDLTKSSSRYKSKAGYCKLEFCAKQALLDNLQFIWVYTCCINQSSSAELQEAINSMFRWYKAASRCYAYLSDISFDGSVRNEEPSFILEPLKKSRWFTRGWTLQELIAPASVEFFSKEGRLLGDKRSLEGSICTITGIPATALRRRPLSCFSVDERISWAAKRQTKREEDAAYALLGIFDIQMPLIYGEQKRKAFQRLRKKIDRPLQSLTQYVNQKAQKLNELDIEVQRIRHVMGNRVKELGFPWETGVPEDQFMIDDGLGAAYLLPVQLCETPEAFFSLLEFRYESQKLPGLPQVQKGHILLLEWNERHLVSRDNWLHILKGVRRAKLSFIMGAWQGPPRNRCMRCFKPRSSNISSSSFKYCHSCKLAVRWVAPDYLPFEPNDTAIFNQDTYRDYRVASRRREVKGQYTTSGAAPTPFGVKRVDETLPSIELVCHKLTMKWEPIFNMIHRYLFCRCVLRLSTPSRLAKEMTLFTASPCPRHNTEGVTFRDYSELALPSPSDPYFDRFGGYNAFWALLHYYLPDLFEHLGGPNSVPRSQLDYGYVDLDRMQEDDTNAVARIAEDYWFEVAEALVNRGANLPPDVVAKFTREKMTRRQGVKKRDIDLEERMQAEIEESPLGKELKEIIQGNWNGVPHWTIED